MIGSRCARCQHTWLNEIIRFVDFYVGGARLHSMRARPNERQTKDKRNKTRNKKNKKKQKKKIVSQALEEATVARCTADCHKIAEAQVADVRVATHKLILYFFFLFVRFVVVVVSPELHFDVSPRIIQYVFFPTFDTPIFGTNPDNMVSNWNSEDVPELRNHNEIVHNLTQFHTN